MHGPALLTVDHWSCPEKKGEAAGTCFVGVGHHEREAEDAARLRRPVSERRQGLEASRNAPKLQQATWVVVKAMVPFWVP